MKAALLAGPRRFEIGQVPAPAIQHDTDVLIKIATVGVCGSDVHYYAHGRIGTQVVEYPFVIGHEAAGTVVETGAGVTTVTPGQRIALDPAVSCGHCDQCRSGRAHTCRTLRFMGCPGQLAGCLAEYVVLPENSCYPLPEQVTFVQATLSEPLAIAVYSVERAPLAPGAAVAILGMGPIGMSVYHVLSTMSVGNVYVTDKIAERLEFARQFTPAWSGNPDRDDVVTEISRREPLLLDVVFECSGDVPAIGQGIRLLKPGGALVIVGIPGQDMISLPIHELRRKEITIINVRRQVHCTSKALYLLASRRIAMDSMATHQFSLDDTQAAFDLVAGYRNGVMKAIIAVP